MSNNAIVTPVGRLSYVNAARPRAIEAGGEEKYSCAIIFLKSQEAELAPLREAHAKCMAEGFEGGVLPYGAKGELPLIDGAVRYPNDPYYADKLILTASQKADRPPRVMVMPEGGTVPVPAMSASDVYSGCYGRLSFNFYSYQGGTKGIAASLLAVCKDRDGESLGGGSMSADEAANAFGAAPVNIPTGLEGGGEAGEAGAGTPPPPSAAPAGEVKTMTAKAAGATYEQMVANGWTDENLVAHGYMTVSQPAPQTTTPPPPAAGAGTPPPPPAAGAGTPPPPAPVKKMTPLAGGATYDQMIANGWTDENLVAHGYMEA